MEYENPQFEVALKQIEEKERTNRHRLLLLTIVPAVFAVGFVLVLAYSAQQQAKLARELAEKQATLNNLDYMNYRLHRSREIITQLIEPRVLKVVAESAGVKSTQVDPDTKWSDLPNGTFDVSSFVKQIDREFNIMIPDETRTTLAGVRDTVDAVQNALEQER